MLFARAPVPGRVKNRLAADIGSDAALRLYCAFVADTADVVRMVPGALVELHCDAPSDYWMDLGLTRRLQVPGDLGVRILHALKLALQGGYSPAMVVETDVPTLPVRCLTTMLASSADVVFGPTEDGGFYAISASTTHQDMFAGVQWSSPNTLAQATAASAAAGLSVALGPVWFDVDDATTLDRLTASPVVPVRTRAVLDELGRGKAASNHPD